MSAQSEINAQQLDIHINVSFDVLQGALRLGAKEAPERFEVPVGNLVVLSYGHEFYEISGWPEVYFAGEVVQRDPLRKGVPCWAVLLSEFPGRVDIQGRRALAGISRSAEDQASIHISFYIRLKDPILLLRRTGGKWNTESDRNNFNNRIQEDIKNWLRGFLDRDIQIWSGDKQTVLETIFSELNQFLRQNGLEIDIENAASAIIFIRHYPSNLYEIAVQFAKAERLLRYLAQIGENIAQKTGFSDREINIIMKSEERDGVALFQNLRKSPPSVKTQTAKWLDESGMAEAASFLRETVSSNQAKEIELSEQIVFYAIRNPLLTQGEWLKEASQHPITRFERLDRKIRSASISS